MSEDEAIQCTYVSVPFWFGSNVTEKVACASFHLASYPQEIHELQGNGNECRGENHGFAAFSADFLYPHSLYL